MQAADDPRTRAILTTPNMSIRKAGTLNANSTTDAPRSLETRLMFPSIYCSLSSAVLVRVWLDARLKPMNVGVYE